MRCARLREGLVGVGRHYQQHQLRGGERLLDVRGDVVNPGRTLPGDADEIDDAGLPDRLDRFLELGQLEQGDLEAS